MKKIILSSFRYAGLWQPELQAQELIKDNDSTNADLTNRIWQQRQRDIRHLVRRKQRNRSFFPHHQRQAARQSIGIFRRPQTDYLVQVVRGTTLRRQRRPGMYKLGFWAKSEDMGQVKVFIRLRDANGKDLQRFFVCTQSQPKKADRKFYGGFGKANPSGKWTYYTLDFNFGKVANSIYQFSMNDTEDATPTDLKNFSICFQNSASEPSSVLIDGVSLKKIEE